MDNIFDLTDTSDTPIKISPRQTVYRQMLELIIDANKPVRSDELRVFYYRKYGIDIASSTTRTYLARMCISMDVRRLEYGVYVSLAWWKANGDDYNENLLRG